MKLTRDRLRQKKQTAVVASLKNGNTLTDSCKAANVTRQAVTRWRKKYPNFRKRVDEALEGRIQVLEDKAFSKAKSGDKTLLIWLLINWTKYRDPDLGIRYESTNRVEHTGFQGGAIKMFGVEAPVDKV